MNPPSRHGLLSPAIRIRDLKTHDDYAACVALQRQVWGSDFQECVAPALLKVTQRIGGIAAGAFEDDALVGFVYGMTGSLNGALLHWSHMLAVAPRARGAGIGRRLKEYQREEVARRGVKVMAWSFDPLVARNAHLNLNVLGATVTEYVESMYAPTASKLHGSLPIDRLVVRWLLDGAERGSGGAAEASGGPACTLDWRDSGAEGASRARLPEAVEVRILVPRDFELLLLQGSSAAASEARTRTRSFFLTSIRDGWKVAGFRRPAEGDPYYLLRREEGP